MNNWNKIINPKTGRKVSIFSKNGKNIINNYLFTLQNGGARTIYKGKTLSLTELLDIDFDDYVIFNPTKLVDSDWIITEEWIEENIDGHVRAAKNFSWKGLLNGNTIGNSDPVTIRSDKAAYKDGFKHACRVFWENKIDKLYDLIDIEYQSIDEDELWDTRYNAKLGSILDPNANTDGDYRYQELIKLFTKVCKKKNKSSYGEITKDGKCRKKK